MTPNDYYDKLTEYIDTYLSKEMMDVHRDYEEKIKTFPASIKHHHVERGGYARHVYEVCKHMLTLCQPYFIPEEVFESELSKERAVFLAYIHDLNKLNRYRLSTTPPTKKQKSYAESLGIKVGNDESQPSLSSKIDAKKSGEDLIIREFEYRPKSVAEESCEVATMLAPYGIYLTESDMHCLATHHGGWSTVYQAGIDAKMEPTAILLHTADLLSARIKGVCNSQVCEIDGKS